MFLSHKKIISQKPGIFCINVFVNFESPLPPYHCLVMINAYLLNKRIEEWVFGPFFPLTHEGEIWSFIKEQIEHKMPLLHTECIINTTM